MTNIGTDEWWQEEFLYGSHGIIHAILILVEAHKISIGKGYELIEMATSEDRCRDPIPSAPWEEVRWPCIEREVDES